MIYNLEISDNQLNEIFEYFEVDINSKEFLKVYQYLKENEKKSKNIDTFNLVLYDERLSLKHVCSMIRKNDVSALKQLSEIVALCEQFCEVFEMSFLEGCKLYIRYGLQFMNKYSLNRFKYYHQKIMSHHGEILEISNDENPTLTQLLIDYYLDKINFNIEVNRYDFVLCSSQIIENKAKYKQWIDAQFKELEFTGIVPEPNFLHGLNALKRYQKYLLNNVVITDSKKTLNQEIEDEEQRRQRIQKALKNKRQ